MRNMQLHGSSVALVHSSSVQLTRDKQGFYMISLWG